MAEYHVGNGFENIYAGTLNKDKSRWINKSEVTNEAIASVFTWFCQHMKDNEEYSITYPSSEYELVMRKKRHLT
jgi:hypothetical protein